MKRLPHEVRSGLRRRLRVLQKRMVEKAQNEPEFCQSLVTGRRQLDSDATFAKWLGVPAQTLDGWLKGNGEPSTPQLAAIADKTDVVLDWLLLGSGGDAPVLRGQWRTDKGLEADVAAHVRRELQASGHSPYAVDHYLPTPDALLALAVVAAQKAAVEESARRRIAYFFEAQRIASRYAQGLRRADGFVVMDAAPTVKSSMAVRWAEILANGATELDREEFPLYDAGEALPVLAELLTRLSPADSPAIALVLQGESPAVFFWRMAGRPTLDGDGDDVLAERRSQPEASIYAYAAEWCLAQQWEKAPDKHFQGHSRWVWNGPNIANCAKVAAASGLNGPGPSGDCGKVAGSPDKPGLLAS